MNKHIPGLHKIIKIQARRQGMAGQLPPFMVLFPPFFSSVTYCDDDNTPTPLYGINFATKKKNRSEILFVSSVTYCDDDNTPTPLWL